MSNLTWSIDADWTDNGTYEADEASRTVGLHITRGRTKYIRNDGEGFERTRTDKAVLTFDNYDGRYDPLNTSSPIYPNVRPGRKIQISVNDGSGDDMLFTGTIEIPQEVGSLGASRMRVVVNSGWGLLRSTQVGVAMQSNYRTDQAIAAILTAAGYPVAWGSNLGTGADLLPYWWADGWAGDEVLDLVESELGQVWIAVDGELNFVGRSALYGGSSLTTIDQADCLKDIKNIFRYETIRNVITVRSYPKVVQATGVIWTLQSIPFLAPGVTFETWGDYSYGGIRGPAENVQDLTITTDYLGNSNESGTGDNLSSQISPTITKFGTVAKVQYLNNGPAGLYLTKAQVRGDAVTTPDPVRAVVDVSGSDTKRALDIDLPWQQNPETGRDQAYWLSSFLPNSGGFPEIQFEDQSTIQFARELFDRITFESVKRGIADDFYIGGMDHEWLDENGRGVRTTFYLETVDTADYWIFPTKIGTEARFAR